MSVHHSTDSSEYCKLPQSPLLKVIEDLAGEAFPLDPTGRTIPIYLPLFRLFKSKLGGDAGFILSLILSQFFTDRNPACCEDFVSDTLRDRKGISKLLRAGLVADFNLQLGLVTVNEQAIIDFMATHREELEENIRIHRADMEEADGEGEQR